ncbi:hypothetical protein [Streptomyces sp. NPDC127072]|uniref:hypothetical protein n=1 Tax=Streptomyces sp. NPDC127072 TaxID=3347129 RepID=UPI00365FD520
MTDHKAAVPEPSARPTRYTVSCLPEGHDNRLTFTIQVEYRGNDLYAVTRTLRYAAADGTWEYEPGWPETGIDEQQAWLAARLFDHDTALRLARRLAPTLTYRGWTVADALADGPDHR